MFGKKDLEHKIEMLELDVKFLRNDLKRHSEAIHDLRAKLDTFAAEFGATIRTHIPSRSKTFTVEWDEGENNGKS